MVRGVFGHMGDSLENEWVNGREERIFPMSFSIYHLSLRGESLHQ
jgi:hypothetical protein